MTSAPQTEYDIRIAAIRATGLPPIAVGEWMLAACGCLWQEHRPAGFLISPSEPRVCARHLADHPQSLFASPQGFAMVRVRYYDTEEAARRAAAGDEHGFDQYGYLHGPDALPGVLVAWLAGIAAPWDGDPAGPQLQLVLRHPDGEQVAVANLNARAIQGLSSDLQRAIHDRNASAASEQRRDQMTRVIVTARRRGVDAGELVVAAVGRAAGRLFNGAAQLVHGRPGSWEADNVLTFAEYAKTLTMAPDPAIDDLADLFEAMGQAREDGGQTVSTALGHAAQQLGGLAALAEDSPLAWPLWNMAKPYCHDDPWEPM